MKKIVSILLICVLMLSSVVMSVVATSTKIEYETENTKELISSTQDMSEKKILCTATTEDEFEADSLIVVFKNTESRKLQSFSTKSFSEISAKSVNELTSGAKNRIEKQRVRADRISRGLDISSNENQYILADVNFDGEVNSNDATFIQKYVGGLVDEFGN